MTPKPKRGRPPADEPKRSLTIRVEAPLRKRLESLAHAQAIGLAELIRRILASAVE